MTNKDTFFKASGCTNPPEPEPHLRMKLSNPPAVDEVLDFNSEVSYVCLDGHSFQHDANLQELKVKCQPDGSWSVSDLGDYFCVRPEGMKL